MRLLLVNSGIFGLFLWETSNCLRQPRHRAKNVGRAPTLLFVSFPMFQCFVGRMHSRTRTNEQEQCELFLTICTRNRQQIRTDGTPMSKTSWFGGVLGPCVGVLEPSRPKNSPGCILGRETHVRRSPSGDVFWYNLCCFLLFFYCLFVSASTTVF